MVYVGTFVNIRQDVIRTAVICVHFLIQMVRFFNGLVFVDIQQFGLPLQYICASQFDQLHHVSLLENIEFAMQVEKAVFKELRILARCIHTSFKLNLFYLRRWVESLGVKFRLPLKGPFDLVIFSEPSAS